MGCRARTRVQPRAVRPWGITALGVPEPTLQNRGVAPASQLVGSFHGMRHDRWQLGLAHSWGSLPAPPTSRREGTHRAVRPSWHLGTQEASPYPSVVRSHQLSQEPSCSPQAGHQLRGASSSLDATPGAGHLGRLAWGGTGPGVRKTLLGPCPGLSPVALPLLPGLMALPADSHPSHPEGLGITIALRVRNQELRDGKRPTLRAVGLRLAATSNHRARAGDTAHATFLPASSQATGAAIPPPAPTVGVRAKEPALGSCRQTRAFH